MTDEERRKPSMPDGELEAKLRELAGQAEKDFGKKAGFARVRDCEISDGNTEIYLEKGFGTKIKGSVYNEKGKWVEMEDCSRIGFSDLNVRVNNGEIVVFELGWYEPCPDWMRVYSQNLDYQFIVRKAKQSGGNTFYSPYYGRDLKVYEGMQD